MKEAVWGYWLVILGIFIIVVLLLVQSFTSTNTQDYYLVKSITEASMEDAIDWSYYRTYGEVKINKEKFYESFLRRFAEEASISTTYTIEFYEIYEAPPKVGVKVSSKSSSFNIAGDADTFDIVNKLDAILESKTASEVESSSNNTIVQSTADELVSAWLDPVPTPDFGRIVAQIDAADCFGDEPVDLEVAGCGTPTDFGIRSNDVMEENPDETYCVLNVVGNNQCVYVATQDEVEAMANETAEGGIADENEDETPATDAECEAGMVENAELEGVRGAVMADTTIYKTLTKTETLGTLKAADGKVFTIKGTNSNNTQWNVEIDGECGWISNSNAAVNLEDFIPSMSFSITNKSGSIYQTSGKSIPNVTGRQLYSNEYLPIARYEFAVQLKVAQANAQANGDSIIVYDAYRPFTVQEYVYEHFDDLYEADSEVRENIKYHVGKSGTKYEWGKTWFLAEPSGGSNHNFACAVDVSLVGRQSEMPSAIHELSTWAVKYYSKYEDGYSLKMSESDAAQDLHKYMTDAGLVELKSEWWHYEGPGCKRGSGKPVGYFWGAV